MDEHKARLELSAVGGPHTQTVQTQKLLKLVKNCVKDNK